MRWNPDQTSIFNLSHSLPRVRFGWQFLPVILLFWLLPFQNNQLSAQRNDWTLDKYREQLFLIQIHAEQVEKNKDLDLLNARIKAFPDEVTVTYPVSNDETVRQKVSMKWMRDYFKYNPILYPEDSLDQDPALVNFMALMKTRIAEMEEIQRSYLDDGEVMTNRDEILSERIYKWKEEKDPEKEEEEEDEPIFEEPTLADETNEFLEKFGTILAVVIIGLALLFLLYLVVRNLDLKKKKETIDIGSGGGLLREDDPRDSESMLKVAATAQKKGKWNAAVRFYYLTLILLLHEEELIRYRSSLTNWDISAK